jgi:hypothetical protein
MVVARRAGSADPTRLRATGKTEEWTMDEGSAPQKAVQAAKLEAARGRADVLGDGVLAGGGVRDLSGLSQPPGPLVSRLAAPRLEPIATAPRDGRNVEVFLGREGIWVEACWVPTTQEWVRADDPARHALYRVTHWRRSFGSDQGGAP